jgi:23S rRNA pseudouridine1911/1915/1917 synthase
LSASEEDWFVGIAPGEGRADVLVAALAGVSRTRAAALIRSRAALADGREIARPSQLVPAGAALAVQLPEPAPTSVIAEDLPIAIVWEDADVAVIDKAAGMVVHPGAGHPRGTLVNALLHHIRDLSGIGGVLRPGIVHRLDRGTSGLLVVAKNDAAHQVLAAQFADKSAGREYLAITRGPREDRGAVDAPIGRHPADRVRFAVVPGGRLAVTHWEVAARSGPWALVVCRLETGRTHQVRVHLAHIGAPLLGDPLYGRGVARPAALPDLALDRPLLHARTLRFRHPRTGEPVVFHADPPADFAGAVAALKL